jgi:hypothetical protein
MVCNILIFKFNYNLNFLFSEMLKRTGKEAVYFKDMRFYFLHVKKR